MEQSIKIHPDDRLELLRLKDAPPAEELQSALGRVDKDVLDAVSEVLYHAKVEKILATAEGLRIDFVRELECHMRPASRELKRIRRFLGTTAYDDEIRVFDSIRDLPVDRRRKKEGRHSQPWINKTRKKLRRLGVSRDLSEDLLLACGIRRPRSNGKKGREKSTWCETFVFRANYANRS
jgi:hypothetical protein